MVLFKQIPHTDTPLQQPSGLVSFSWEEEEEEEQEQGKEIMILYHFN